MPTIENTQQITKIIFEKTTINFRPDNQKQYINNFTVTFVPWNKIPDYNELEKAIDERINHKTLIIEDTVKIMFDVVNEYVYPKGIKVVSYVDDGEHFPVFVESADGILK